MMLSRVWLCRWLILIGLILLSPGISLASPITVTDMLNRKVTLEKPAQKLILIESRQIFTLGLFYDDPVSHIVAWGSDLPGYSPESWQALVSRFPAASKIQQIGNQSEGTISMESVIATKPDLVIFYLSGHKTTNLSMLDKANIPYIFVDFYLHPIKNTLPSIKLLGAVLGREDRADAFIKFYKQHIGVISARLADTSIRPKIFFHANPGRMECCQTSGHGRITDFIATAGGENISENIISGAAGKINLETVISLNPDFYLMSGGSTVSKNGLKIGPSVTEEESRKSLYALSQTKGINQIPAIKAGRFGGIWLFFFDNPLSLVAIEEMAKMFHPELFSDIDPDNTLQVLNSQYLSVPLEGTFWIQP